MCWGVVGHPGCPVQFRELVYGGRWGLVYGGSAAMVKDIYKYREERVPVDPYVSILTLASL